MLRLADFMHEICIFKRCIDRVRLKIPHINNSSKLLSIFNIKFPTIKWVTKEEQNSQIKYIRFEPCLALDTQRYIFALKTKFESVPRFAQVCF